MRPNNFCFCFLFLCFFFLFTLSSLFFLLPLVGKEPRTQIYVLFVCKEKMIAQRYLDFDSRKSIWRIGFKLVADLVIYGWGLSTKIKRLRTGGPWMLFAADDWRCGMCLGFWDSGEKGSICLEEECDEALLGMIPA
ncbi:hypothetical protein QBC44DRAFT_328914 [Cladorrhinum sp. PSN332]|nr:hypothetical protein QBC44DRAFT_328914 [Cladorrhinum sp. PSN332]